MFYVEFCNDGVGMWIGKGCLVVEKFRYDMKFVGKFDGL